MSKGKTIQRIVFAGLVAGPLCAPAPWAQENGLTIEYSFANPGARSMGLGGAFVALADDATAALANPAGLVQITRPEVSLEGRHWSFSTPYTKGGRVDDLPPTGLGLDRTRGLRSGVSEEETSGVSFLSFVYPGKRWSVAVYRHLAANYRFAGETQGLFYGLRQCGNTPCPIRHLDQRWSAELEMVSYGLSGAYRVTDTLSLGLGLSYTEGSMLSTAGLFFVDDNSFAALIGPNHYLPWREYLREVVTIDDSDWVFSGGFLWKFAKQWSLGGVYRQGPTLDIVISEFAGPAHLNRPAGELIGADSFSGGGFPDVLGLGTAWRSPDGRWTVGFEWDRVGYSSLFSEPPASESLEIDDAHELHLGGEYVFLSSRPLIALRVGAWKDPDHRILSKEDDPLVQALRRPGDDVIHGAVGLGIAFQRFQIDLAVDLSETVDTVSLSGIYSF